MSEYEKEVLNLLKEIKDSLQRQTPQQTRPYMFTCKGCGYQTSDPQNYLEHVATETIKNEIKNLNLKDLITTQCKNGICKIIEETYDVRKKEEKPKSWL